MNKIKYIKYKNKYLNFEKSNNLFGGNKINNCDEDTYKDFLLNNMELINDDIKFLDYFIKFTNQIEQTLNNYIHKNKLNKLIVICTSNISSIIGKYFETLEKCKNCEFIYFKKLVDENNIQNIITNNFKNLVIIDYIFQYDEITNIIVVLDKLQVLNSNNINNKYYLSNNKIIENIKKEVENDAEYNTDPIEDDEFESNNNVELNGNFLNLYDFVNISSLNILKKDKTDDQKILFVKLLFLSYIYKSVYQRILSKYESNFSS